ncbi:flagellin [Clostridium frigidicarnis]|uniref:Flagellin n=1 Tax=Clostridium frigidicarnis TaxID=84698 RepID=A0A1I0VDV2_9CLOT|nr:flagellin [Clostridium frigidicarnis]SFA74534.1 flagellin [Clostridium frigidicarnis]
MRLYHNMASMNAYKTYTNSLNKQSLVMNRINTGSRINKAKDNPNAMAKSETMQIQIRGLQMAQKNVQDGVSMMQSVDGSLSSMNEYLNRIRELTVQAGGATGKEELGAIQNEINQMVDGMKDIIKGSDFNGVQLIGNDEVTDNSRPKITEMLAGANSGDVIKLPAYNLDPANLKNGTGESLESIDITNKDIDKALSIVNSSIKTVTDVRTKYGAVCNRLETAYDITGEMGVTLEGAQSSVADADVALEMMDLAKYNILVDSSLSIMRQTNNFPQDVLRILENLK